MAKITFSFLLLHSVFQDTISYEVEEAFTFEDVILHICNSFGFTKHHVSISSNLGTEIDTLMLKVSDIAEHYGHNFKMVVTEHNQDLVDVISQQISAFHTVEQAIEVKRENTYDEWQIVKPQFSSKKVKEEPKAIIPQFQPTVLEEVIPEIDEEGIREAFYDAVDNLYFLSSDTWQVDEYGNTELVVLPRLNSYITQLRIKFPVDKSAKQLFTKIAFTCGFVPRDILVLPLQENAGLVEDIDISVEELLEQYGGVFLIYPEEMREEIVHGPSLQQQIQELIYKYKT